MKVPTWPSSSGPYQTHLSAEHGTQHTTACRSSTRNPCKPNMVGPRVGGATVQLCSCRRPGCGNNRSAPPPSSHVCVLWTDVLLKSSLSLARAAVPTCKVIGVFARSGESHAVFDVHGEPVVCSTHSQPPSPLKRKRAWPAQTHSHVALPCCGVVGVARCWERLIPCYGLRIHMGLKPTSDTITQARWGSVDGNSMFTENRPVATNLRSCERISREPVLQAARPWQEPSFGGAWTIHYDGDAAPFFLGVGPARVAGLLFGSQQ